MLFNSLRLEYGATTYEDGTPVTMKDAAISRARGEELYNHHLNTVTDHLSTIPKRQH